MKKRQDGWYDRSARVWQWQFAGQIGLIVRLGAWCENVVVSVGLIDVWGIVDEGVGRRCRAEGLDAVVRMGFGLEFGNDSGRDGAAVWMELGEERHKMGKDVGDGEDADVVGCRGWKIRCMVVGDGKYGAVEGNIAGVMRWSVKRWGWRWGWMTVQRIRDSFGDGLWRSRRMRMRMGRCSVCG